MHPLRDHQIRNVMGYFSSLMDATWGLLENGVEHMPMESVET